MRAFQELIATHEDWLVNRVLHYAKRYGYTRYSSTLLEAWRQSVVGLSTVLIEAVDDAANRSGLVADTDYSKDSITSYGVEEARKHRNRGVTLPLFLSLLKYYRQSYLDLVVEKCFEHHSFRLYYDFSLNIFDKIEIGCSSEWVSEVFFKRCY